MKLKWRQYTVYIFAWFCGNNESVTDEYTVKYSTIKNILLDMEVKQGQR